MAKPGYMGKILHVLLIDKKDKIETLKITQIIVIITIEPVRLFVKRSFKYVLIE